jgi:hypothetical protein
MASTLKLHRHGAVGFIDGLDGLVCIIHRFPLPRAFNWMPNSAPTNRQIGKLQNRRVKLHCFTQRNDSAVLRCAIAGTDELPAVIVGIMRDVENESGKDSVRRSPWLRYWTLDPELKSAGAYWGGDGANPIPGVNLNELLGSLSEFAALLPALILRMLLASPYQQGRLRPFFRGFCQDFA